MSDDIKECFIVEDEHVQVIVIKKNNCSMRDAIHRSIYRLNNEV